MIEGTHHHDHHLRAAVLDAANKVLQDPSFRRAPVMSHLLEYLVDRSFDDEPIKSYTIATEALGRAHDDGADADTYARVAVARLRKALISYYADHPDEDEIYVDTGTYAVRIRSRTALPVADGPQPGQPESVIRRLARAARPHRLRIAVTGLLVALLVIAGVVYEHRERQQRWTRVNFPTLAVVDWVADGANGEVPIAEREPDSFGNVLRALLADYFGIRLLDAGAVNADYVIRHDVDQAGGTAVETITLTETATDRIVWTRQYPLGGQTDMVRSAQHAAASIAALGGALSTYDRRKGLDSDTPYGCWLRFTESVLSYSSRTDSDLLQCAEDWHAADEGSRTAAFIRNWTMVDASMTTLDEERRRDQLTAALAVAHQALLSNPGNGMLYLGEMRTYSFLGRRAEVIQAARSAMEAAPDNRVIAGLAGTFLTFWNDPQGKEILSGLGADSAVSLPWEHAGLFVAAMMEDDPQTAGLHLSHLRIYLEDQPALNVLEAAYYRRIGREQAAEAALETVRNRPSAWFVGPDGILQRMPLAPEVKARLGQWLAYGTTPAQ